MLLIDEHPLLDLRWFVTEFPHPLGQLPTPLEITALLQWNDTAPVRSSDQLRQDVRDLLRYGGFKPTGRSKPASEYLIKAANAGKLSSINLAVDACNAVSLHSGLPISVVDLEVAKEPFRVGVADSGETYVFNRTGQAIDIGGLLCLFDAEGPCANAVKDSQRTKTSDATVRTLTLVWGTKKWTSHVDETEAWYRELLDRTTQV